jgi:hypothetical protein
MYGHRAVFSTQRFNIEMHQSICDDAVLKAKNHRDPGPFCSGWARQKHLT